MPPVGAKKKKVVATKVLALAFFSWLSAFSFQGCRDCLLMMIRGSSPHPLLLHPPLSHPKESEGERDVEVLLTTRVVVWSRSSSSGGGSIWGSLELNCDQSRGTEAVKEGR